VRILAVETATQPGSVALHEGDQLLAEMRLPGERRTTQTLFPAIQSLLNNAGWQTGDVQLVAVSQGPGSFTGLRIGVTLAKTWAYARRCDVLGLPTLDLLAAQAETDRAVLWALLDAQRGQWFAARYRRQADGWQPNGNVELVDRGDWLSRLEEGAAVTGEGLGVLEDVASALPPNCHVLPRAAWTPWAATLARLAWQRYSAGARSDLWGLRPYYCRKSAAEETADRKKPAAAPTQAPAPPTEK
jgi:tRNA threonylcarbamoyladenosine biosynthesis protein TsaB